MSLTQRVKQGFLRLPILKKAILVSSFGLILSALMPWYDHRNSFGIGDTYLGIQGPLFLIGFLVLGCGAASFFNIFFPLMGRNFFNLRRRGGTVALILGAQALLLLLVANSIFYHPSFGLNVGSKGTRFGMMLAFFFVGTLIISGWLTRRKEKEEKDEIEEFLSPQASGVQTYDQASLNVPPSSVEPFVDPLTIDPRTRYKMMQSKTRLSTAARNNFWGSGSGSAFARLNRVEEENKEKEVTENMRIRMDL